MKNCNYLCKYFHIWLFVNAAKYHASQVCDNFHQKELFQNLEEMEKNMAIALQDTSISQFRIIIDNILEIHRTVQADG